MRETPTGSWLSIGTVGPFKRSRFYSVNVRKVTPPFGPRAQYCAELWRCFDTGGEFNSDSTKQLIVSRCPKGVPPSGGGESPESQVTNNSQSLLRKVKIGAVEFTENLDYCGTGCSTDFSRVAAGDNQIMLQQTSGSAWQTLSEPLGPFENGLFYSVNITSSGGGFCAELRKRGNTDLYFNDDTGKQLIESHCF